MITNALDDKPLPIYGDGKHQRTWLFVEDTCSGILAVLERGRVGEIYNLGGVDTEENLSMARRLLRLLGKPESLLIRVEDRPGHDRRYALNCVKIELQLGWKHEANPDWLAKIRSGEYRNSYEKYHPTH